MKFAVICCFYLKGGLLETINRSFELTIAIAGLDLCREKNIATLIQTYAFLSNFISLIFYRVKLEVIVQLWMNEWMMNPEIIPIPE